MIPEKKISLAFSSCPNDTFIFKAIASQFIQTGDIRFQITVADVDTLNQKAHQGLYDVTKLSVAAFGRLTGTYRLLRAGAALGKGCGPLVVSLPGRRLEDYECPKVAVPGLDTTACHLFKFYIDAQLSQCRPDIQPMTFDRIMPAVKDHRADFGVIIHEGRFIYQDIGLDQVADLGHWWEQNTKMPIPLGCIAVKKSLGMPLASAVQKVIRNSIDHAFKHPVAGYDYILQNAIELEESVISRHIELYVNDFSRDLGPAGLEAIALFFKKSSEAGLMEQASFCVVSDT